MIKSAIYIIFIVAISGFSVNSNEYNYPKEISLYNKNKFISVCHGFAESQKGDYKSIFHACINTGINIYEND